MSLSVVLVTYRRPEYLPSTIESILSQTYSDFELIISDDASNDQTLDVANEYARIDKRVRVRSNATNLGMPGNLNAALKECSRDLVVNCHDADIYASDLFKEWTKLMLEDDQIGFSCCNWHQLDESWTVPIEAHDAQLILPRIMDGPMFLLDRYFTWSNVYFGSWVWGTAIARRKVYEELGFFDPQFGFYADVDMWMRIALKYKVGVLRGIRILCPPKTKVPNLFNRSNTHRLVRRIFWKNRFALASAGYASLTEQILMHAVHASTQEVRYTLGAMRRLVKKGISQLNSQNVYMHRW
ncbi:MAG: glycosyltransferase family 2 protein [Proteobacteria bacterium]|nr:glycosyltransferase family 2 protein [Pseudomonadota bacterium]